MVERKADIRPVTPSAFDRLILLIKGETGQDISLSTMKRVWGYIQSPHTPSNAILSILARFVGFKGRDDYVGARRGGITKISLQKE